MSAVPWPVPDDTRGIIDPVEMMRYVDFARSPAGDAFRRLTSTGWTVAARTSVGGLGVLLDAPARAVVDTELSLDGALPGLDGRRLIARVRAESSNDRRVDCVRRQLNKMVSSREPSLVAEAREVTELAAVTEYDRTVRRVEHLATLAGISVRTLQRLFDYHVGVSPSFVIRRWRIIEAAEAARKANDADGEWSGWATVAAELGYADQAHLTRDFRRHLGTSPAAYLAQTTRSSA